jgi:hypothetical protein
MSENSSALVLRSVPPEMAKPEYERLAALSTSELRAELHAAIAMTAQSLLRMAVAVRLLEDRGEDIGDLRLPLLTYLRRIASGQLLPNVVARFAEFPQLIGTIGRLPIQDQTAIANGEPVRLVVRHEGKYTHLLAEPTKLTTDQRRQVFASDHLRHDDEQILIIESRNGSAHKKQPKSAGRIKVSPDGTVKIGRIATTIQELLTAISAASGERPEEDLVSQAVIKLSPTEHKKLKITAAESGTTVLDLCRRALIGWGLI